MTRQSNRRDSQTVRRREKDSRVRFAVGLEFCGVDGRESIAQIEVIEAAIYQ